MRPYHFNIHYKIVSKRVFTMDILERIFVYNFNLKTNLYDYLDHDSLLSLCQVNKMFREKAKFIYNLIFSKVSQSLRLFIQSPYRNMIIYNDKRLEEMMNHYTNIAISRERDFYNRIRKRNTNIQDIMNKCNITILLKNRILRKYLYKYTMNCLHDLI